MGKYRINVNTHPGALEGYNRFKKAFGLPYWAPPSDGQRLAFDVVFDNPNYDFERFLELAESGNKLAECMRLSRRNE